VDSVDPTFRHDPIAFCSFFFWGGSFTSHEDAFGFKYNVDALPSFYEVSESAVVEDGFSAKNRDHGGVGPIPPTPIPNAM